MHGTVKTIKRNDNNNMKVIVAGSRTVTDAALVAEAIKKSGFAMTELVSGCCEGADTLAEEYAQQNNIPIHHFPADWKKHGKSAGPKRNKQMAEYGQALVAVWDGCSRGTADMINKARNRKLKIYIHRI